MPEPPPDGLVRDLASILEADRVLTSGPDRLAYNTDCSPRGIILARGRRLRPHQPSAIVQPTGEGELSELVQWARNEDVPLVPYGAGSGVCRGALADEASVIVDLKQLDGIVETNETDGTARIRAGTIGMLMEKELQRRGLTLGHYPSSLYCSSLGGYLAARSAGQYSSRYGKIEDMVASMRVVTGTGDVLETAPDPMARQPTRDVPEEGPHLNQIFVGSEGTLGFVTEATMHVEPRPDHLYYRGFQFSDLSAGLEATREIVQAGLRPTVLRLYDPFDTLVKGSSEGASHAPKPLERLRSLAEENLPDRLLEGWARQLNKVRNAVVRRTIGRPMAVNTIVDSIASSCLMIVGFEGTDTLVEREADYAFDQLSRRGVDLGSEPGWHWRQNRFAVSYKQSPLFETGAFVDTMEISTTWSNLESLYRRVRRALRPHVLPLAHFSHVYPEGSSIYFTMVGFAPDHESTLELYETTWEHGLDAVQQAGGSITHHHGVGELKRDWTEADHAGGRRQFEALKAAFDPDGIMNPGKVYR
jgi:alkyldihydroxyacetonephosphate synthase